MQMASFPTPRMNVYQTSACFLIGLVVFGFANLVTNGQEEKSKTAATKASPVKPTTTDSKKPVASVDANKKDWSMFRGNSLGTGVAHSILKGEPELLWSFKVKGGAFESTAAIVGDVVYISDLDGKIYAIDLKTGKKKWEYKTESGFSASPSVKDGLIFVGDYDGTFYCLTTDGKLKWKFETEAEI